jgi:hypothetical protein
MPVTWCEKNLSEQQRKDMIARIQTRESNANKEADRWSTSRSNIVRYLKIVPESEKLIIAAEYEQKRKVKAAQQAADVIGEVGDDIDGDLRYILRRLRNAIESAEDDDKLLELAQLREMRHTLESLAKIRGMFNQRIDVQINLAESPQWMVLRQIMTRVLDAHPDAKLAFMREMRALKVIEGEVIDA